MQSRNSSDIVSSEKVVGYVSSRLDESTLKNRDFSPPETLYFHHMISMFPLKTLIGICYMFMCSLPAHGLKPIGIAQSYTPVPTGRRDHQIRSSYLASLGVRPTPPGGGGGGGGSGGGSLSSSIGSGGGMTGISSSNKISPVVSSNSSAKPPTPPTFASFSSTAAKKH